MSDKNLNVWLHRFRDAWIHHDIDAVMSLFTEEVEYWETPFKKLASYDELHNEWMGIHDQSDIELNMEVYSSVENKHSVIWRLSYCNGANEHRQLSGTYLITLNDVGQCTYFLHTGELKP